MVKNSVNPKYTFKNPSMMQSGAENVEPVKK